MYISLTILLQILTVDSLKEDQVITEEETIDLLESTRHALLGRAPWTMGNNFFSPRFERI